ncbi:lanthionine synthetase C family protein [Streptomyces sp. H39-S7]|uniref:lanthionine synthetase C family protein n=1 Tax=Streptomyces sp. H39-S7 TaxID=3004357 RepID=UPI0022AF22E4|nr:lanthionine synthetase C family protein [Streptomyces sp. H39-S7]MCZ4123542.1 lanthionine synthetase C family protein [Streptomyces sp. H39-S7]
MTVLETGQQAAAEAMVDHLAADLTVPPQSDHGDDYSPGSPRWRDQSLSKGAAGVAVLHGLRARHGLADDKPVHAWLARATRDDLTAGPGAGLWFGAPALAFALQIAAPAAFPGAMGRLNDGVTQLVRTRIAAAHARIDAAQRPSQYEFDLTRGLVGLGAHLLHREPGGDLVRQVLAYLVRLTEPVTAADEAGTGAPGWWTSDSSARSRDPAFAAGEANFGMAHGCSGLLAILALAMRQGVTVDGQAAAIERICRWLEDWRQQAPAGPWWPERISLPELHAGQPHQDGPLRPSWCYGTPGLARAQQLAALALGDRVRQQAAEDALVRCLADPVQLARISGPALCHGWAGLLMTAWHAATDAATPDIAAHIPQLLDTLLTHARHVPPGALPGLIEGSAGVALTLHTLATGTHGGWPACLLLG